MKPFERSCLYHATRPMRVVEESQEEEYKQLLDSGEWFDHPSKVNQKRTDNEEQIRRSTREGSGNSKLTPKKAGVRAQSEGRIREEPAGKNAGESGASS